MAAEYGATSGMRQLHRICWYPIRALPIVGVNQGGTAEEEHSTVLDNIIRYCQGRFVIARKEIKRQRSCHLISPEQIRSKIKSREATMAAEGRRILRVKRKEIKRQRSEEKKGAKT